MYRKFHLQKTENFQIKNSDICYIFAQNIDCEYPESMFLSRNKNPVNPSFTV